MPGVPGILIRIGVDAKDAARDIGQISGSLSRTATKSEKFGAAMSTAMVPATAAIAGLAVAAKGAVDSASRMEQSVGAVDKVFGKSADTIKEFGENSATAVGLSTAEFQEMASVSGAMLQNLGYSASEAADATVGLTTTAADLSAVFGGPASDAMDAMNAALRGEYDSLEKYGIKLSESGVQQAALSMGLADTTAELTANDKATAALALIQEGAASSAGAFADESDTAAVKQQQLAATVENLKAGIGEGLLPVFATLLGVLQTAVTWISENQRVVTILVAVIGGLAAAVIATNAVMAVWNTVVTIGTAVQKLYTIATKRQTYATIASTAATIAARAVYIAIRTVMVAIRTATLLWTAAQWLLNAAMLANPIGLVVIAIVALIAIVVAVIVYWDDLVEATKKLWEWLKDKLAPAFDAVSDAVSAVVGWFKDAWEWCQKLIDKIKNIKIPDLSSLNPFANAAVAVTGVPAAVPMARGARAGTLAGTTTINVTVNATGADPGAVVAAIDRWARRNGGPRAHVTASAGAA